MGVLPDFTFYSASDLIDSVTAAFKPPPKISLSEWAEEYRRLSPESSASPGRINLDRTPYMREPMDMVGTVGVKSVAMMTSAQVGKSTFIENVIGYYVHLDPCPILHISPTLDSMKMFSKERLAPMIRDTPVLRDKVRDAKTRDSGNTIASKRFPGGHIAMVGSNAPAGLASRPIRILVADEVDRFERSAGTEGDPLKLGIKRTTTYWNRVLVFVSTPGDKYNPQEQTGSRIEKEFLEGDQRYYHAKCPHCDHEQKLKWSHVRWEDGDPNTAVYVCEENGCIWDDLDRFTAIGRGRWIASKPFNGRVSYHLSQLYSMFAKLSDGVTDFLDSKNDPMLLKTWVNTFLGETWEDKGARLDWSSLKDGQEDYNCYEDIPAEITVITAAVDVQGYEGAGDALVYEFIGWGTDNQSWSLDYGWIYDDLSTPDPWNELDQKLKSIFIHPIFGQMAIRATAVDSGGGYTQSVYDFCNGRPRTVAIKGVSGFGKPFVGRPSKNTLDGTRIFPLGVDTIKETVTARLRITDPETPGYCRWPLHYDDDYFRGITAEELKTKFRRGFKVREWVQIRKRNEPFDLRVYNTAALDMLSLDLKSHRRTLLREADKRDSSKPKRKRKKKPRTSSWAESWKNG